MGPPANRHGKNPFRYCAMQLKIDVERIIPSTIQVFLSSEDCNGLQEDWGGGVGSALFVTCNRKSTLHFASEYCNSVLNREERKNKKIFHHIT